MRWGKVILGLFSALAFTGCSGLLYFPTRHLHYDPARLNLKPTEVNFSSGDGTKLFGWHFKSKQKAKATVVFFHGNAENLSSHYLNMAWILEHPFDLFIFDYQGYGRSEGSPTPAGTVADGIAAMEWAASQGLPLVVFGQSLGGAVALRAVAESKARLPIKYLAVDSTFPSYRSMGQRVLARSIFTWPLQWIGWLVMSDAHAPDGLIETISPIPLLVIHGEKDGVVEIEMGERVFSQAKDPKEFWRLPSGGHTDIFSTQDPAYKQKFVDRIERAL
jgi:uncharacterized protein